MFPLVSVRGSSGRRSDDCRVVSKQTLCVEAQGNSFGRHGLFAQGLKPRIALLRGPGGEDYASRLVSAQFGIHLGKQGPKQGGVAGWNETQGHAGSPAPVLENGPYFTIGEHPQDFPELVLQPTLGAFKFQELKADAKLARTWASATRALTC